MGGRRATRKARVASIEPPARAHRR
jgi:hypothetical protein